MKIIIKKKKGTQSITCFVPAQEKASKEAKELGLRCHG